MRKKLTIITLFFLITEQLIFAQPKIEHPKIDSLKTELSKVKEDTIKAKLLNALASALIEINEHDAALTYCKAALELSEKLNFKKEQGNAFSTFGIIYENKSEYSNAISNYRSALKVWQETGDKKGIAGSYNNLGVIYGKQGNFSESLKMNFAALKINEAIDNKAWMARNYNNLGIVFNALGNYPEAVKMAFAALKIYETMHDSDHIVSCYNNIGTLYWTQKDYEGALKIYSKTLKMLEGTKDSSEFNHPYNNMAGIYYEMGNNEKALECYEISMRIRKQMGDKDLIADSYSGFGGVYLRMKKYQGSLDSFNAALKLYMETGNMFGVAGVTFAIGEINLALKKYEVARDFFDKAMVIYKEVGDPTSLYYAYESYAKLDSATGNFKSALENYKQFIFYRDSSLNQENSNKLIQAQMQYDFDKKEIATKAEQDKKQALAAAEILKHKLVRNFSFAGIFVVLLIGGYGFYRFRENKQLENQQSLLAERLRISRELHDDMGSTLSSISVYSEVAKNRAAKNENETEVLQKIGNASRELIEKMSDIVWSLNPNNENFEQLKNRMMAFAAMMLTPKGILFQFEIDDEVKSTSIAPEQRKNIFLIYKEAINNIVKYSEATSVKVKVKVKENKLSLEILDNGKGFDTNNVVAYNGNGLKNMKARAAEIKALFNVTSAINEGVKIELAFNI
jgi:two-component system, NarL family, sensor histidine kinase UhpB